MRLADWPRMPFLNDELCGWIAEHLATLGVAEEAVFAVEEGPDGDGRRVMVATELALIDYRYGPRASTARFAIVGRFYPWPAVRGVDFRVETTRLWALEHTTRWWLQIAHPAFRAGTDHPQLGQALADFAKVAVLMGEPAGPPGTAPDDGQARSPEARPGPARSGEERPRAVAVARPAPAPTGALAGRPPTPRPASYQAQTAQLGLGAPPEATPVPTERPLGDGRPPVPGGPGEPTDGSGRGGTPVGPGTTAPASRPRS